MHEVLVLQLRVHERLVAKETPEHLFRTFWSTNYLQLVWDNVALEQGLVVQNQYRYWSCSASAFWRAALGLKEF